MNTGKRKSPSGGRAAKRRPAEGRRRDAGFSFIEVVVSIVLIGIVVIAILTAVRTSIVASSVAYKASEVETVLLNAADRVDRATIRDCDYQNEVNAAAPSSAWSMTIQNHQRLVHSGGGISWSGCAGALGTFDVERLEITATSPDGEISRTMMVVKSDAN